MAPLVHLNNPSQGALPAHCCPNVGRSAQDLAGLGIPADPYGLAGLKVTGNVEGFHGVVVNCRNPSMRWGTVVSAP